MKPAFYIFLELCRERSVEVSFDTESVESERGSFITSFILNFQDHSIIIIIIIIITIKTNMKLLFHHAASTAAAAARALPAPRSSSSSSSSSVAARVVKTAVLLRGGGGGGGAGAAAAAAAAAAAEAVLGDHRAVVSGLFNNMRTPAALVGGAIVPLGIITAPVVDPARDGKRTRFLKRAYQLVALCSMYNELLAIVYATIACNKLAEVDNGLTRSCTHLIGRDYELEWIGTNLHFLGGLAGFGAMVGLRLWMSPGIERGPTPRTATATTTATRRGQGGGESPASSSGESVVAQVGACWTGAALCTGMAIVNRGIAQGDGRGGSFGKNLSHLVLRYFQLVAQGSRGALSLLSVALVALSAAILARAALAARADCGESTWRGVLSDDGAH